MFGKQFFFFLLLTQSWTRLTTCKVELRCILFSILIGQVDNLILFHIFLAKMVYRFYRNSVGVSASRTVIKYYYTRPSRRHRSREMTRKKSIKIGKWIKCIFFQNAGTNSTNVRLLHVIHTVSFQYSSMWSFHFLSPSPSFILFFFFFFLL